MKRKSAKKSIHRKKNIITITYCYVFVPLLHEALYRDINTFNLDNNPGR